MYQMGRQDMMREIVQLSGLNPPSRNFQNYQNYNNGGYPRGGRGPPEWRPRRPARRYNQNFYPRGRSYHYNYPRFSQQQLQQMLAEYDNPPSDSSMDVQNYPPHT